MNYKIDKQRVDALMEQRGIDSYKALSELAASQGVSLAYSTIYQAVAAESNIGWRSTTLAALCYMLQCSAVDLIPDLAVSLRGREQP